MPQWVPKVKTLEDQIAEEEERIELARQKSFSFLEASTIPQWQPPEVKPTPDLWQPEAPAWQAPSWQIPEFTPAVEKPILLPSIPQEKPAPKPEPISVPFWQRALQIFAAPFQWIDENIIRPGLAVTAATVQIMPEVERLPGEDFWEWKKRSWAKWETPGINISVPWRDEPLRLDVRGIMELAPWLLIPGAGQVGGGLRAARGVAGVLGKLGTAGRVLGTAVEYSPWGLVEKTAGVAIKGGIRAVGKVSERVSTVVGEKLYGKIPELPPPTAAEVELIKFFKKEVIPARTKFEEKLPSLRAEQELVAQEPFARARGGKITYEQALLESEKALGEVPGIRAGFAVKARQITTEEMEEFFTKIDSWAERGLVEKDTIGAMRNTLLGIDLPEPHHLRDFAKVFGKDFATAIGKYAKLPRSRKEAIIDAMNIPRSIIASWDISAVARQGSILSLLHPTQVPKWFGRQIKALLSEKWSLEIDDAMRADPLFKEFSASGAYIAPLREATFTTAEELFASRLAHRVPGIRRSERAFATYLNQARFDSFKSAYNAMTAQGATAKDFKLLGEFLDIVSGRGRIPASMERFMPVLNLSLFSPRFQASILQLPRQLGRMLLSDNPYMRKEAAKALVTFVGGGAGLLALLNGTGRAKVEIDPRSGDFGKIKIGETRLDIWRGYVQYARFVAQLLTGERKSAYGNMSKAERQEIAWRFLQSKASPAFGLMVDLLRGELYFGQPIFKDTTGFLKAAREKVIPLAVQDIIDAMEQSGTNGALVAAPALLGVGALTYINDFVKVKEKIAREMGFDTWDDVDPKTQREIQNRNAELQAATINFDRQVMGTAWGDWRLAGNAIEDVFRNNVELAVTQFRATGDGYKFREKVADAFTARRGGYSAREKEERFEEIVRRNKTPDTLESLVALGPEQLAIKIYNNALYGDDMYDEFGDYRFDEAEIRKRQLRQQLDAMQPGLFNYVEEYQNVKYETLPPEFQELMRAKKVLRPYWQVRDEVINIFKEPKTQWQANRIDRMITKVRKNLRRTNPQIEKYFQLFYVRPSSF